MMRSLIQNTSLLPKHRNTATAGIEEILKDVKIIFMETLWLRYFKANMSGMKI